MFDRLVGLIGNDNLLKLQNTNVLLVGIGGVGGMCLESLVRSVIGHITIVDGDEYELSNLNRQIGSKMNNIGISKVDEAITRKVYINYDTLVDVNYLLNNKKNSDFIANDYLF